jgi:polysaccharide biosynthesis/export protein
MTPPFLPTRFGMRSQRVRIIAVLLATACAHSRAIGQAQTPPAPPPSSHGSSTDSSTRDSSVSLVPESAARNSTTASRIGPHDVLEISVLEAPELLRTLRVAETGLISVPLLGEIRAAGQTPRELELSLEAAFRKSYIRDPHVSVQVKEMQSRGVSVVGAVAHPGVFQIQGSRSLLEIIALAGGLTKESGEGIIVMRGGAPSSPTTAPESSSAGAAAVEIALKDLLDSADPRHNVPVHPGDIVKVIPAGIVYVVGEVRRPGAFPVDRRSGLTVLQAIALSEGLGPKASKGRALLIRVGRAGERVEIPVNLGDVISGKQVDPTVQPKDVIFVPSSTARSVAVGTVDALVRMVTLRGVF